jgi:hypothetical protein
VPRVAGATSSGAKSSGAKSSSSRAMRRQKVTVRTGMYPGPHTLAHSTPSAESPPCNRRFHVCSALLRCCAVLLCQGGLAEGA